MPEAEEPMEQPEPEKKDTIEHAPITDELTILKILCGW